TCSAVGNCLSRKASAFVRKPPSTSIANRGFIEFLLLWRSLPPVPANRLGSITGGGAISISRGIVVLIDVPVNQPPSGGFLVGGREIAVSWGLVGIPWGIESGFLG